MDEHLLEQRVAQWQQRPGARGAVVAGIAAYLARLPEPGTRLYPHAIAAAAGDPAPLVLPELLHAVPAGLLDLHWDIRCPQCDSLNADLAHLQEAVGVVHCPACTLDYEADFAANVEVTFSLNSEIAPQQAPAQRSAEASTPRLSGLDVLHEPAFRELFGEEVLSRRERLRIAAVTTLFTDVVGSTAMYERLGDPVAYNVVRDHFDVLFGAIERRGGTILKTIGDAVMASFVNNRDAVQAVIDAFDEFQDYNAGHRPERNVHIKTGIHRGPAILVNLNERLDYFGSTINRAARLQGVAGGDQIVLSRVVNDDPDVREALAAAGLAQPDELLVDMKGVDGKQAVYRWQYGAPPPAVPVAGRGLLGRLFGR